MWNPYNFKTISPGHQPARSLVVNSADELPLILDHRIYNLFIAPYDMPPRAQKYFDNLDLRKLAESVPVRDHLSITSLQVNLFNVASTAFGYFKETAECVLPDDPFRDDFTEVMTSAAKIMLSRLKGDTVFSGVVCCEGERDFIHIDRISTSVTAFWQPNSKKPEKQSRTTVIADEAIKQYVDPSNSTHFGRTSSSDPSLLWVAPSSSILFWNGERSPNPLHHSEPVVPNGGPYRFNLIGRNRDI